MIKAVHKFSFIIKHTGTFRCVCVCTALYGAYNCQGFLRQASKLILSVTVRGGWGYNRFPYMRLLLTRQEDEIESATYDAQANDRNHWSIGASQAPPVNIVYFLAFR